MQYIIYAEIQREKDIDLVILHWANCEEMYFFSKVKRYMLSNTINPVLWVMKVLADSVGLPIPVICMVLVLVNTDKVVVKTLVKPVSNSASTISFIPHFFV